VILNEVRRSYARDGRAVIVLIEYCTYVIGGLDMFLLLDFASYVVCSFVFGILVFVLSISIALGSGGVDWLVRYLSFILFHLLLKIILVGSGVM